jgi:quinol monooxygenase YgiN
LAIERRTFLAGSAVLVAAGSGSVSTSASAAGPRYGLIGKMTAQPGKRAELAAILLEGVAGMPGCLSYVIANDPQNADLLWITEAWESREAHAASLSMRSVQEAIAKGRPLIADMTSIAETVPVGGHGLVTSD